MGGSQAKLHSVLLTACFSPPGLCVFHPFDIRQVYISGHGGNEFMKFQDTEELMAQVGVCGCGFVWGLGLLGSVGLAESYEARLAGILQSV